MSAAELEAAAAPASWLDERRRDGEALSVRPLTRAEDFGTLRAEWTELLESSRADCIFLTWEWLYTWWQHLGSPGRLGLLLVRDKLTGRLDGVAPIARGSSTPWRLLLGAPWQLLGTGAVGSDYLDLIVRPGVEAETLEALASYLDRHRMLVELQQLPREGSTAGKLAGVLASRGWTVVDHETNVCPIVDLAGKTWDGYVESLGRSHRQNLRRRLRQLEASFDVELERVESPDQLDEAFEALVALHRLRWDARGGSDALADPEVVAFHRDFGRLALQRGWLRLFVLRLNGYASAALLGFRYRDRFLYYQSGFDEAFARHSPGLVIMALAIRSAIEEGAQEYDLLHGAEAYKFHWATGVRQLGVLELYPPSIEALVQRTTRRGLRAAKRRLRSWVTGARRPLPQPVPRGHVR